MVSSRDLLWLGQPPDRHIAVLVDGDNAQASLLEPILAEAGRYGQLTVRRIYADFTEHEAAQWKPSLEALAIRPVQQFRYTKGKNATDSTLIIDAMDLVHDGAVAGFCIVSSDSDYTGLAVRLREKGLFVMGIGRQQTPQSFVKACEVFFYTDNLAANPVALPTPQPVTPAPTKHRASTARQQVVAEPNAKSVFAEAKPLPASGRGADVGEGIRLVMRAVSMTLRENDWSFLGAVGNYARQLDPAFDPRRYGFTQLTQMIKTRPDLFELDERKTPTGPTLVYVRPRLP